MRHNSLICASQAVIAHALVTAQIGGYSRKTAGQPRSLGVICAPARRTTGLPIAALATMVTRPEFGSQINQSGTDAVVRIGAGHWLRIPLGKLRNDRYVPLHPELVQLLAAWTAAHPGHIRRCKRLAADHRGPLDRHIMGRIVARVARAAGVPGVHPHRLRHTLATQAINRGMRLEAIAALLGHQKMETTLIYAKIANRVAADEYAAVTAKIDALYGQPPALPADYESRGMARLRRETHARMPGNGLCTRPAELDCRMESACETRAYFRTSTEFLPILVRQRDHAQDHGQADRAELFSKIIQNVEQDLGQVIFRLAALAVPVPLDRRAAGCRGGSLPDRFGGVELDQQAPQLGHLGRAELLLEFCLDPAHGLLDGVQGGVAAAGVIDAPGALVVTVAAAGEIASLLQLPE
jgi:Phage integrase family